MSTQPENEIKLVEQADRTRLFVTAGPADKCLRFFHLTTAQGFIVNGLNASWCSDANFSNLAPTYHRLAESGSPLFLNNIYFQR